MAGYNDIKEKPSGAIYDCPMTGLAEDCQQVPVNKSQHRKFEMIYGQQFLGMNLISATVYNGTNVFTCAPRRQTIYLVNGRELVPGACYNLNNDLKVESEIIIDVSKRKSSANLRIYWFSLIGMAVATNARNQAMLGAPFSSYSNIKKWIESGEIYFSKDGRSLGESLKDDTFNTRPLYPGWSVAMGKVLSGCDITLVAGAPGLPGENLDLLPAPEIGNGSVFLISYSYASGVFVKKQRLVGNQFGSRFGHSVLVADVNKDGWEDLFVGAPDLRSNRVDRDRIGSGAVFVYLSNKGTIAPTPTKILRPRENGGKCKNNACVQAQFGFALSNLGDVNLDGYNDIGISAPGEFGGTIYVFHGGKDPFAHGRPAQTISLKSGKKLGYSLGQGMDLDNNGYPDLVAGVLGSNTAAVFRTRPIIDFKLAIVFEPAFLLPILKDNPKPWRPCDDRAKKKGFCFNAVLTFSYDPVSPKHKMNDDLSGEISIVAAKSDRKLIRVQFLEGTKLFNVLTRKTTFKRTPSKETVTLFIASGNFMDVLRPIIFEVTWKTNMKEPEALDGSSKKLSSINQFPVYDKEKCNLTAKLPWRTDCPDSGCVSDLELRLRSSLDSGAGEFVYFVGKDSSIWLNFTATNFEGTAHLVELHLTFDETLVIDKVDCKFSCKQEKEATVCGMANPLKISQSSTCNIHLSTANVKPEIRKLNFAAKLTTTSKNLNKRQYEYKFNASVIVQAAVHLTSRVNRDQVMYKKLKEMLGASAVTHESKIGNHRLEFTFEVDNKMDTLVPASTLTILWPYELLNSVSETHGKYLLYLLAMPQVSGRWNNDVNCSSDALQQIVNPLGVRVLKQGIFTNYSAGPRLKPPTVSVTSAAAVKKAPKLLPCSKGLARCVPIQCKLGRLGKKTGTVTITLAARVWIYTLISSFAKEKYVKIFVDAKWQSDPRYDVRQINNTSTNTSIVIWANNEMTFEEKPPQHFIWIIIGASVGGLILLGCIVIILWKCKFFQRKNLDKKRQQMMRESRMRPTEAEAFFSDRPA